MANTIAKVTIKKECREVHGIEGAFDEACKKLKQTYNLFAKSEANKDRTWVIELK